MYLGVTPSVANWSAGGDEFSLLLDSNPLAEFVELPDTCSNMRYSALLPGIVRGACEMVRRRAGVRGGWANDGGVWYYGMVQTGTDCHCWQWRVRNGETTRACGGGVD